MRIEDFEKLIEGKVCRWCGELLPAKVEYYEHSGGLIVDGFAEKLWLYVTCTKCKYQWALRKLGIMRE